METQNKIIELSLKEVDEIKKTCNEKIELAKALNRLTENEDFNMLFNAYTKSESERLVKLLAEPQFNLNENRETNRKEFIEQMIGIARFSYFCNVIIPKQASMAENTLHDLNAATIIN